MKRSISFIALLTFILSAAEAQTIAVTGTVKDAKGNPLHYAFVQDKKLKNSTYTDSVGVFSLAVDPASKLLVKCNGFKDTLININNRTNFSIILRLTSGMEFNSTKEELRADNGSNSIAKKDFNDNINLEQTLTPSAGENVPKMTVPKYEVPLTPYVKILGQGTMFPVFTIKEETRGSRYLFDKWQPGYVINAKDSLIKRPNFMFNYDKMGGGLLLTQDERSAIEVNRDAIKSFTLYNNAQVPIIFENVPEIDRNHYVEVIATGKKYRIYKLVKTKFEKSNYSTDGVVTTGNPYDEYIDEGSYFVIKDGGGQPQKIALKKKSIKETFAADGSKLNQFMTDHSADDIDDNYLKNLGDYMNQ